jgi:hypothetical protein
MYASAEHENDKVYHIKAEKTMRDVLLLCACHGFSLAQGDQSVAF